MKIIRKKICLLGGFAVGKTSLVRRFVENRFDDSYLSTVGVKVSRKPVITKTAEVAMMLWDISGRPDFEHLRPRYLKGAAGALLVCDLTRPETVDILPAELDALSTHSRGCRTLIVANKSDLRPSPPDALVSLAARLQTELVLTSALTGHGVEEAFNLLAAELLQ